jgi:hypothetical protein
VKSAFLITLGWHSSIFAQFVWTCWKFACSSLKVLWHFLKNGIHMYFSIRSTWFFYEVMLQPWPWKRRVSSSLNGYQEYQVVWSRNFTYKVFLLSNAMILTFDLWPWKTTRSFLSRRWSGIPSCKILKLRVQSPLYLHGPYRWTGKPTDDAVLKTGVYKQGSVIQRYSQEPMGQKLSNLPESFLT